MTEEVKATCNCKEKALEILKQLCIIAGGVFIGATLAILLSANILKPKCPCSHKMMGPYPRMERHLPPPMMHRGEFAPRYRAERKHFHHTRKHHGDFRKFDKMKKDFKKEDKKN